MKKVIGLGEYAISNNISESIKTIGLSSCVAVMMYSQNNKILGMVHIVLPNSIPFDSNLKLPGYYADTAVKHLLHEMCFGYGCKKDELIIKLFGGADSTKENDLFAIGKKNVEAVTKQLSLLNLKINFMDVGGTSSRTVEIPVLTGKEIVIYSPINI